MNGLFSIIILVAVAITLASAGAAWIITTYNSMTSRSEVLKVLEVEIYFSSADNAWFLRLTAVNEGEVSAEIYKVEVEGVETVDISPSLVVRPGEIKELPRIKLREEYEQGVTYSLKIYLKSGTLYPVVKRVIKA
ncbi:MAG: hypothetical protein QXW94_05935 [Desulfurococcaceae archaeon]